MGICPLAVEWGSVADWVAAVVAAAGAVAVVFVTRAANNTARASHELAKQLKDRDEDVRDRDRAVLVALIYGDVYAASLSYQKLLDTLEKPHALDWAVQSSINLDLLERNAAGPDLSRLKNEVHRFNLLPVGAGEQIAMGMGMADLCVDSAKALRAAGDRAAQEVCFGTVVRNVGGAAKAFSAAHHYLKSSMKTD